MEIESNIIETGVDRLVNLVKERGRIALTDAARELGVSTTVIQEWVDFLEDEGIISVEYKLTKPFLVERKLTKKEVEKKAKEFSSKKDVFVRKAEVSLSFLEKQAEDLKKVKDEFDKLKNELGFDLDAVKSELAELEKYQQTKEELRTQIEEQRKETKMKMEEFAKQIFGEQKKYFELVADIKKERDELAKESTTTKSLEETEKMLNKRLQELKSMTNEIEKKLIGETQLIKDSELHVQRLNQLMDNVRQRVEQEKAVIGPLVEKSREQEKKVMELQDIILKKIQENEKNATAAKNITQKFKSLFEKKLSSLDLLYKVNKDRDELEIGLMELIKKAKGFELTMKKGNAGNEMVELEKRFNDVDKKKNVFEEELKKLISVFH